MNMEWARTWLGNFTRLDEMMKFYRDDVQFEDVTLELNCRSSAEVRAFFASFGEPNAGKHSFIANRYVGTAEGGAVEWTWVSDHERDFLGHPAAGKHTEVHGVSLLTFVNGKIATQLDLWDSGAAYKQLGVI